MACLQYLSVLLEVEPENPDKHETWLEVNFEFHSFARPGSGSTVRVRKNNIFMPCFIIFEWRLIATCQSALPFDCLRFHPDEAISYWFSYTHFVP